MLKAIIQSSSLHFGKFCISETFQRHYYGKFFEVQARMPVPIKIFFVAQKKKKKTAIKSWQFDGNINQHLYFEDSYTFHDLIH